MRSDYVDFSVFRAERPEAKARYWKSTFKTFLISLVFGLLFLAALGQSLRGNASSKSVLIYGLAAVVVFMAYLACRKFFVRASIRRAISEKPGATLEGNVDIVMDGEGVHCTSEGSRSTIEWGIVRQVQDTPTHIFLMVSDLQALLIPKRDLSPELASEIVRFSTERVVPSRS